MPLSALGHEILDKDVERVLEAARAINIPAGRRILHTLRMQLYQL